ncbi:MAG: MASE1 domain-containing protein [Vicinamibacterales bacterium]|nr:MASE1 domain-containing protein [Vicinamibacterales bacterium]
MAQPLPSSSAPAPAATPAPTLAHTIGLNLLLAFVYWAVSEVTLRGVGEQVGVLPLWPATGVALAAVYRYGPRLLPGVFLGSALTMVTRSPALGVFGVALASMLQVPVEIRVMTLLGFNPRLERVRDSGILGLAVAPAGALVSALIAIPFLMAAGVVPASGAVWGGVLWWLRNWLGTIVVGGFVFAWLYARPIVWTRARALEAGGVALVLLLIGQSILGERGLFGTGNLPFGFVFFPLVGWAGLRFGARGAATVTVVGAALATVTAAYGMGAAALVPEGYAVLVLHVFFTLGSLSGLVLAGVMAEREEELRRRLALEEQLRHSQKMEAVGRLAGGIAHDFNNLLTAIIGYNEIVLQALPPDHGSREDAEEIGRAAMRAAELTRQMLAFSRRQILQPQVVNLNTALTQVEPMLRRVLGEDIVMTIAPRASNPLVRVDRGQLEQVIMNMVVNARDAMPQGGRLTVETADALLDEEGARLHRDARPGSYAVLAISDTGVGMSPETRARIFDPYFTTKDIGKGTGLGLSTAYGIVQQSDGHVSVYSEVGMGTTFRVYLPRAEADTETVVAAGSDEAPHGTEHILLVEDDKMVRRLSHEIMVRLGYSVTEAASGRAALALGGDDTRRFDLLLCDVVLGDINGPAVAEAIRALRPSVRVLFMSGYTDDAIVQTGVLNEGVPFLQKPFTPVQLAQKIREVLDAPEE